MKTTGDKAFDYWFLNVQVLRQPINTYKRDLKIGWDARPEIETKSTAKLADIKEKASVEELTTINGILVKYKIEEI